MGKDEQHMGVRRFHRDRLAYFGGLSSEAAFAGVTSLLPFDETQQTRSNVALPVWANGGADRRWNKAPRPGPNRRRIIECKLNFGKEQS